MRRAGGSVVLSALRQPGVGRLVAVGGLEYLLEYATSVVLMVLVYDLSGSPLAAAAMLVAKQGIPGLLLARFGAALDRLGERRRLRVAYAVRGVAFGLLGLVDAVGVLVVLAFVAGMSGGVVRATLRAQLARATHGAVRRQAIAANNILFAAVGLLGPAVGAAACAIAGAQGALAIGMAGAIALALAAPGAVVASASVAEIDEADVAHSPAGLRSAAGLSVGPLLVLGGLMTALFAMDEPALLAYAERTLGSGLGGYGGILVAWGIGMIAGGFVYSALAGGSVKRLFIAATVASAAGYLGLGLAPTLVVALAMAVLGGIGNGFFWASLSTLVFEASMPGDETRQAGRLEAIATATPAAGMLLGGLVAEYVSLRVTLLAPGILALLAVLVWAAAVWRSERRELRPEAAPAISVKALA
jgi:MFS family permease